MDQPRDDHGQFVTLREYVMSLMDERFAGLRKEIAKDLKALDLQAKEYERRLTDLNHAHARAQDVQHTYVTKDKYDTQLETMESARKIALERVDERLTDYITRYEARQREIDQALDIGKGAALEAQRIAEEQGRRSNRNMAIVTIILSIIIAFSQWIGIANDPPPSPALPVTTTTLVIP